MKVIAIVSQKGGAGKTTTASALAAGLVRRGKRVLAIDGDFRSNLTFAAGIDQPAYTLLDVFGGHSINKCISESPQGYQIIAGNPALLNADRLIKGKEQALGIALESIKRLYDYVIIDTPGAMGLLTAIILDCSNQVIIPVQPDYYDLQDLQLQLSIIDSCRRSGNPKLKIAGILICRYKSSAKFPREIKEDFERIARRAKTRLFDTVIRESVKVSDIKRDRSRSIIDTRTNAGADYNHFVDEYLCLQK